MSLFVKVVKYSDYNYWYRYNINDIFEVEDKPKMNYGTLDWVRCGNFGYIEVADCIIVETVLENIIQILRQEVNES